LSLQLSDVDGEVVVAAGDVVEEQLDDGERTGDDVVGVIGGVVAAAVGLD
jgi:hypothetical protein